MSRRAAGGESNGPPISSLAATTPATVAAADDPRPRASGIRLRIEIRQPTPSGSSPRPATRAASRPRTNRFSRSSVSSSLPSPSTVSSISPRLQPRTSTSTRFISSSASPRQSYPAPRFADEAGTSTVTRRPSSSASQCPSRRSPPPERDGHRAERRRGLDDTRDLALRRLRVLEPVPGQDRDDRRVRVQPPAVLASFRRPATLAAEAGSQNTPSIRARSP